MMLPIALVLGFLALLGHAALWIGVVNRWHGTGFRRVVVKSISLVFYAALLIPLLAIARLAWDHQGDLLAVVDDLSGPWIAYVGICVAGGIVQLGVWLRRRLAPEHPSRLARLLDRRVVDVRQRLGCAPGHGLRTAVLGRLPGNQVWQIHIEQHEVRIAGLPRELDGFSLCHWSDLHLSGRLDRGYYREVVAATQQLSADLLALSGDVCDHAPYIDWVGELFAQLQPRAGKFCILGNHDLRTRDVARLRKVLAESGFVDVGGSAVRLEDRPVLVAGNERPWFANRGLESALAGERAEGFRLLLSHSPDRLAWARQHGFHLMLAGHTHGGQVCFPLVGPVLCPSLHGTRYASGLYHQSPTLLHVSRGTASLFPVRVNCPAEITKLILRPAAS
jgi:predicted MPP superfamily phosphohydrolase